ncbi:hypothetical protein CmeUKMEL1_10720 [Cryptosporidium meleagridis]|uniref:Integral membrane protein n=1 Tax=Cryptosporidium meleagridis TaxID=93969 RepID=A0A2P4Z202_9CRYT|nr:hypothetical protein CmeUKMEL1_10720 [Cryptosporidium meleagridis]
MLRFFLNFVITFLSLSFIINQAYCIRVEPRVTSLLNAPINENISKQQSCVLETLKELVSSYGRIPPKITKKRIQQAVLACRMKLTACEYPTIVEETIFITLGQYGHLSQIDTVKALSFINEIQKGITNTVGSYTRMYKLSQNSNFCKLYDDFIISGYPKEYYVSFLPEDGERCQELLNRLKQNSFYSYWGQGGIVADQAQPIVDDKVSNDPIRTKDMVINNIFENPSNKETQIEESPKPESVANNKTDQNIESEYENHIHTKKEVDNFEEETVEDSGCCRCSCNREKTKKGENSQPPILVDSSMTEEELELIRLEKELEEENSGCFSNCSCNKKKEKKQVNRDEMSNDILQDGKTNNELKMEENKKEESSSCCSCSSNKDKKSKTKNEEKESKNDETQRIDEQTPKTLVETSMTDEELELIRLEKELEEENSGCFSSCSCNRKKSKNEEKDKKDKKQKKVKDEQNKIQEELDQLPEEQLEDEEPVEEKKKSKDKKDKKDKKSKKSKKSKKDEDLINSLPEEKTESKKSSFCSVSCCCSSDEESDKELKELAELEKKLQEEEEILLQKKNGLRT